MASSALKLPGVDAKLVRAEEHLTTLEREILAYLGNGVARFPAYLDRQQHTVRVLFDLLVEPPLPLCVIAGDVVHNTRSALDHLWGALTRSTQGGFPVYRKQPDWEKAKAEALSGIPETAHAVIERLQPCSGTDEGYFVGLLNLLSNRDKHKLLNMTAAHAVNSRIALSCHNNPGRWVERDLSSFGRFQPQTYIEITELPDDLMYGKVDVQVKGQLAVAFKDAPLMGQNTRDTLRAILNIVKDDAIPSLRSFVHA
jgi:hypothetical protein